jgi:pyruvate-formate lyase-activating enzyme
MLFKKRILMDYIDRVYVDLKDRPPGKFLMSTLAEPEKFIEAVKFLIDGGWITNVHWDSSYSVFTIQEKFPFKTLKKQV